VNAAAAIASVHEVDNATKFLKNTSAAATINQQAPGKR